MNALLKQRRDAIAALCRRHGVTQLDVFGSALDGRRFDDDASDIDTLASPAPRPSSI